MNVSKIAPLDSAVKSDADEFRQPYAYGSVDLNQLLLNIKDKEKRDMSVVLIRDMPRLSRANAKGANPKEPILVDSKLTMTITAQIFDGSIEKIREKYLDSFTTSIPISQRVIHGPGKRPLNEQHNEMYVKFGVADFHGLIKSSEKNVEGVLSVVDHEGRTMEKAIEVIMPDEVVRQKFYKTRVFVQEEKPALSETIKIVLPEAACRGLHLRMLFYNRKSAEKNKPEKGPFALAFIRIINEFVLAKNEENGVALLYRVVEPSRFDERNVSYLQLFATRNELKNRAATRAESAPAFVCMEKNHLPFQTIAFSSLQTTAPAIVSILQWRINGCQDESRLKEDLKEILKLQLHDDLQFLPHVYDALFEMARVNKTLEAEIFIALLHLFRLSADGNMNFEEYAKLFHFTDAFRFLLGIYHKMLEKAFEFEVKFENFELRL